MGQTTSGGNQRVRTSVSEEFQALQQLVGDWIIDEQVFLTANAEPIVNTGRMTCRSVLGGLAMVVITEIATTGERTVQLVTFNPRNDRYEQTLISSLSDVGIVNLTGRQLDTRSAEDIRIQFGKAATLVWEWTLEQNQNLAGEPGLFIPERIVENRINADLWVLQFFGHTAQAAQHGQAAEFLIRQQVITRASVGCLPLVGCELGCAGLVGCQEGCEGFQGPTTQQALGCSCQSTVTGQPQLVTQPPVANPQLLPQQLVAQQVIAQPQLIAQQLVTTTPMVGLVQAVAVVPPTCPRQVLRPVPLARTGHAK